MTETFFGITVYLLAAAVFTVFADLMWAGRPTPITRLYRCLRDRVQARRRWARCVTVTDLADTTADMLEGVIKYGPGGRRFHLDVYAPQLLEALVALNRTGFVTVGCSTGGTDPASGMGVYEERAAVTGFADTDTKDWLAEMLWDRTPLTLWSMYELYDSQREPHRAAPLVVGRRYGSDTPSTNAPLMVGGQLDAAQIRKLFPRARRAQAALRKAWQITIYDQRYGPNDLWPYLVDACQDRAGFHDRQAAERAKHAGETEQEMMARLIRKVRAEGPGPRGTWADCEYGVRR